MAGKAGRLTWYEKAELWNKIKKRKQLPQQQYPTILQDPEEQQNIGKQLGQQSQQQPVVRAEIKKLSLYEKAELWYKYIRNQQQLQQQQYGQQYLQKQQLQQQKVQQQLQQQQQQKKQKPFQDINPQSTDMIVQGPILAKDVLHGRTYEQGLSRHSTQLSLTPAEHVQQNQQQQPTHSLISDVMSMPTSSLDPHGNAREDPGETEYVDGRHPGAVYLMYPYMKNGSVRKNIEKEEKGGESGKPLCSQLESNYRIWLRCIYQVAQALDYLHNPGKNSSRRPVYHRDLTSRNILFDENFNVKVCDFGLAVEGKYSSTDASVSTKHISSAYHPGTMDPERYSAFDDVHSFCVVILEILTGKVVKDQDPFSSYKIPGGDTCLLRDIDKRAKIIKVANWANEDIRNHLAKKACDVLLDGKKEASKRKKIDALDLVKEPDVRIESYIRYQMPYDPVRCVSCYVNPAANLSLKGKNCEESCKPFCVYCLSDYHNQLVCPRHGSTRPPFGDHVYGVFVAGNHVKELHGNLNIAGNDSTSLANIAGIFSGDAKRLVSVLTSKFPLILGAREEHLKIVTPKEPGKESLMMKDIEEAFNEINKSIRQELSDKHHHGDGERIKNSLFIFYFTGHGDKKDGLYLGGKYEKINASTDWLKKMLHEKLLVDQILVILDCCHAAEQDFSMDKGKSGLGILQLSSCDRDQKSIFNQGNLKGSYFSHLLCQALRGDNFVHVGDGQLIKQCQHCEHRISQHSKSPCEEFHLSLIDPQSVTLGSVEDYIRKHYKLLKLPMKLKVNSRDVEEIHIGYFKPEESSMSIYLKGSRNGETYIFRSAPKSMSRLKKDIVKYIEEKRIQCEILDIHEFHKKLDMLPPVGVERTKYLIKNTSSLVAIHPRVGKEKQEQTDLKDLWKIRPCGRALEAQIRDSVKGLKNGPVKLNGLVRAMTSSLKDKYVDENLNIGMDYIHVQMKESILGDIYKLMNSSENFGKEFKELLNNLHQVVQDCMCAQDSDGIRVKEIKFKLYEEFAILGGE